MPTVPLSLSLPSTKSEREAHFSQRVQPLVDIDVVCIAEALRSKHSLRILNLEENGFGHIGLQALVEALAANPGVLRELRLGKNKLKAVGNAPEPRPPTAAISDPANPPKAMAEPSPVQPDLQHSQHTRPFTLKLESTPRKQEQVGRKQPPRNA
jgi:hypothetical protein